MISGNIIRALRIHDTGVVYRFQDVVTKGDADDNRDVIVHMDPVNHFWDLSFGRTGDLFVPCGTDDASPAQG